MNHWEADHRPTSLTIRLPLASARRPCPRRTPVYSRQAVYEAVVSQGRCHREAAAGYACHLLQMPPDPYQAEPTEHAEMIQQHMREGLVEFFPAADVKSKVNDAISDPVFALIRHKGSVHKLVSFLGRRVGRAALQYAYTFWVICSIRAGRCVVWQARGLRS